MRGIPILAAAVAVLVVACYTGPGADHFVAIVDELVVPDGWQAVETVVRGPDQAERCNPGLSNECPAAIRTYLTQGDVDAAYAQAKDLITGAGFSITDEATSGCRRSSNSPACSYFADRGKDQLLVQVFSSPPAAGLDGEQPDVAAVVVHAYSID